MSHHEVYVDDGQMAWLEETLAQRVRGRPVVIFTHAPPMGCGLKVLQEVHVKNRCAWLNHSDRPQRFLDLVRRHANIRLWFSGHFHLSHNYPDSISVVGSAAFVQTGVIGTCNRDGMRQSRILRTDAAGYEIYTVDHEDGALRLDMKHEWADRSPPVSIVPDDELLCDTASGWLCSQIDAKIGDADAAPGVTWLPAGPNVMLALQANLLVEYDMEMAAAVGVVAKAPEGTTVRMLDVRGNPSTSETGSDVAFVEVTSPVAAEDGSATSTLQTKRYERNAAGGFYQIFQPNKWRLKQEKKKAEAAAAAAAISLSAAAPEPAFTLSSVNCET